MPDWKITHIIEASYHNHKKNIRLSGTLKEKRITLRTHKNSGTFNFINAKPERALEVLEALQALVRMLLSFNAKAQVIDE